MQRLLLILFITLALAPCAHAQLDPATKKPYHFEVVLQIGANRVFTPLFQEQLQRDVRNQLKLLFGDLARIDVVRQHALFRDIESKGLDAAIDGWDALSERSTHFVLLDYRAGAYQIQSRSHDGATAQASPSSLRAQTHDRAALASTIARLVETSFSPVGAVTAVSADGKDVTLKLQAGELGSLDRWVKAGHVFAVCRISDEGGKQRAARLEWTLLEATGPSANGVCACKFRKRYQEDDLTQSPGTLGYRAVRLPTVKEPVRLQLLDDDKLEPLNDVRIVVSANPESAAGAEKLRTDRDGMAMSKASFPHLAWVQVLTGDSVRAQFPVELLEGRTIIARVKLQADREGNTSFEVRRDAWLRRAYDNVRLSSERSRELAVLLNQSLKAALDSGRKSLPLVEAEIVYLDGEYAQLNRLVRDKKLDHDLREGAQQIDELREQAKELKKFVDRLDAVLKEPGSEEALGLLKLIERAQLLERDADYDKAIRLYDQVVQASPEQSAKIKAHADRLKADWSKVKDEEHVKFVYERWPTLDVAGLDKGLTEAAKALAACKASQDKLTPKKLLIGAVAHTVNVKKHLETLKRKDSEDNRNQLKILLKLDISNRLLRLHDEASAFVAGRKE